MASDRGRLSDDQHAAWWRQAGEQELRELLFWRWDPIGVSGSFPNARDEYDAYAPRVAALLRGGASAEAIDAHLEQVAVERMGLAPGRPRAAVGTEVVRWYERSPHRWLREPAAPLLRGPLVGGSAIVVRDGRALLGQRQGAHGEGEWAFPGGKVDAGEDAAATVARELEEETGLVALDVRPLAWTTDVFADHGLHYVTLHHLVAVADDGREPRVIEPQRCRGWGWFAWDALPAPLFAPVVHLADQGWRPGRMAVMSRRDELDRLSSKELHDRAVHRAEKHLDIKFLWNLMKLVPAAEAGAGQEDQADFDVAHWSGQVADTFRDDDGALSDALRPFYLDYLEQHTDG